MTERFDEEAIASESNAEETYFTIKGDVVVLTLPAKITRSVSAKVDNSAKTTLGKAVSAGVKKYIIDISRVANISMNAIQVIISQTNGALRNKMMVRLVASQNQTEALQGFKETSVLDSSASLEEAVSSF